MKTRAIVPLVTYPEANADAVAANAVAAAGILGADLHAVALNADIPEVSNVLSRLLLDLPQLIREAEALSRKRGEHLLAKVREEATKRGVAATTGKLGAALALLGDAAAAEVRYFDVALLAWEAANPGTHALAEAVVFGSGRPAILLPELSAVASFDHVAVAWDGSRVAARALADALVLLEGKAAFSVLTVVDEKPIAHEDAAERLAATLRDRGLRAEAFAVHAEHGPIGVCLQERAIEAGAGLLVMGGYGHSRLRDFVLGGATANILDDLRLPVLLSH